VQALGRMLARENTATDLLALLIELDPAAVGRLLPGVPANVTAVREATANTSKRGRLDLLLRSTVDESLVAVFEMKGAADLHGDQLSRYDAWLAKQPGACARYFCSFDGTRADAPANADGSAPGWTPLTLESLFGAWRTSAHPHAAWLSEQIVDLLSAWSTEAAGPIGAGHGWYVPDVITRRVARQLHERLTYRDDDNEARATRTSAGNPMLMAWRRDPVRESQVWLGLDVRSQGRGDQQLPWLFRPCVDVATPDPENRKGDQLAAHDRAAQLAPTIGYEAVRKALIDANRDDLASALRPAPKSKNGFRRAPTAEALADWRVRIDTERTGGRDHPVFFHDRGTRLATQLVLDVSSVTVDDLADLCYLVLDHMAANAVPLACG